jgi:hypothetical protein
MLLAPTWIAVNAAIGLWFSQSIFQFARTDPRFPDQFLHRGFDTLEFTVAAIVIAIIFGAGLIYWGNRFKSMRRTTIILYGILGGAGMVAAGRLQPPGRGGRLVGAVKCVVGAATGALRAGRATPAALGLLADISGGLPADRGAIMGLYSVFLAIPARSGSLIGGFAASARASTKLRRHLCTPGRRSSRCQRCDDVSTSWTDRPHRRSSTEARSSQSSNSTPVSSR